MGLWFRAVAWDDVAADRGHDRFFPSLTLALSALTLPGFLSTGAEVAPSPPGQLIEADAYYAFSSVFFYTNRTPGC